MVATFLWVGVLGATSLGLPSQRMPRAAISVSVRGTVLSRLTWGRFDLQAHSHGFQQNGVPQSLLRRGYLILCHMSVPCLATQLLTTYFIKVSKQQEPQKECKQERSHCLLHLILLYSLFIRGKSVDPAHPSGCEHQEKGIPGAIFGAAATLTKFHCSILLEISVTLFVGLQ